jgi:hypothetical protein
MGRSRQQGNLAVLEQGADRDRKGLLTGPALVAAGARALAFCLVSGSEAWRRPQVCNRSAAINMSTATLIWTEWATHRGFNMQALSPTTQAILALIQGLLPLMTGIVGGIWIIIVYLSDQEKARSQLAAQVARDNVTRTIEAQRPFLKEQLDRYIETAKTAGELVTLAPSPEWDKSERRFWQLFFTELSMVEDQGVKRAMQNFGGQLKRYKTDRDNELTKKELERLSYVLAVALRQSIIDGWKVALGSLSSPEKTHD